MFDESFVLAVWLLAGDLAWFPGGRMKGYCATFWFPPFRGETGEAVVWV